MTGVCVVVAVDEATSWSSQYFVQTLTRMADSSRAKVKEVMNNHQCLLIFSSRCAASKYCVYELRRQTTIARYQNLTNVTG